MNWKKFWLGGKGTTKGKTADAAHYQQVAKTPEQKEYAKKAVRNLNKDQFG